MNENVSRRIGAPDSKTRSALIAAAIHILKEQGYAALTARQVAEKAGLKPQLVHYYFRTMDDLVLALVHAGGDEGIKETIRAAAAENPLLAFWKGFFDTRSVTLTSEVMAMAAHRESIRSEAMRFARQRRTIQAEAIAQYFERQMAEPPMPPVAIVFLMSAVSRAIQREAALGYTLGHAETISEMENWLGALGPTAKKSRPSSSNKVRQND